MAIRAPTVRKHLSADALFGLLRTGFADIADHRPGTPDIALTDALMSAFAMFSLKSPSLLAFDQERTEGNLQRVYGIERVGKEPVGKRVFEQEIRNCHQMRVARILGTIALQRAEIVGVPQLRT